MATLLVANQLASGSIAAYDTAYLLFVVPHGLLAASFMTALMPELARSAQRGDRLAHFSPKNAHPLELLVGKRENPNFAIGRHNPFHARHVHHRVFFARAVANIN